MSTATQLRFKNLEPTEAQKELLLSALGDVKEHGPDEVVVKARLKRRGKSFVANARVHSGKSFFKAQVQGRSVKELAAHLRHNLIQQLEKWKNTRRRKREVLSRQERRRRRLRVLNENFTES